jgi:hypothetical protein
MRALSSSIVRSYLQERTVTKCTRMASHQLHARCNNRAVHCTRSGLYLASRCWKYITNCFKIGASDSLILPATFRSILSSCDASSQ